MAVTSVTQLPPPPSSQDQYAFAQWIYQAYTILTNTVQLAELTLPVSIANGGTNASTLIGAKTNLGIPSSSTPLRVSSGGTGVNSTTAYAPICGGTTSTGNLQAVSLGTSGQVLTSNGTGALPSFQSTKAVQYAYTTNSTLATGTTTIPMDNSIPQNTEGNQFLTQSITPKSSSNILLIEIDAFLSPSITDWVILALFQDTTANALAAVPNYLAAGTGQNCRLAWVMAAGTTSATTFKFRAGTNSAGTLTFNGVTSAAYMGGVMASSIKITEFTP